jgi:predicted DNA-binding transcriptional regulator AlpA
MSKAQKVLGSLPQRFIRAKELASWLGVSPPTLRLWVKKGALPPPAITAGRIGVWDLVQVEEFLRRRRAGEATSA